MEKLSMCRVCLMQNVRMCVVTSRHLQDVYEKLTNIPFITEDSRPMLACSYCYARLKQCYIFLKKCLHAEDLLAKILIDYEQKPIKIQEDIFGGLITTSIQHLSIVDDSQPDGSTVKEELLSTDRTYEVVLKEEPQSDVLEPELEEHAYPEENNHSQSDSEDDIPLTKIKIEVDGVKETLKKKGRVKRKYGRKLNASEIILTKEEQLENLEARSKSANYTNCPFKCALCYKGFIDMRAYYNHKIKHEARSGAHVCDICRMHYRTAQHLRTHVITAHARIFKCNKCGHTSQTANQARIHDKWHNGHTYECQLCSHSFSKPTSYFSHMRKRHPTEHVCNICGESFVGKHGLKMHKRLTHINDDKVEEQEDPEHPATDRFCSECNIQFVSLEAWKRHILYSIKHTLKSEQSTQCSICSWRFVGNVTLATHMKEHAKTLRKSKKQTLVVSDRHLRCSQCGSNFVNMSKLQAHIKRTHLGLKYNKNIVCEVCGKKCTSNATLKYHQRTHTGEKPYSCASCSKHFSDSNQLRIHTRTHTGEKPYVCTVCGKRFTQKPALNRHYRVHTGVKPYTCQYCSRTFSQSNSLKLHVKTVHLKQPANSRKKALNTSQDIKITEKNEQELHTVAIALN